MKSHVLESFAAPMLALALAVGAAPLSATASTQSPNGFAATPAEVPGGAAGGFMDGFRSVDAYEPLHFPDLTQSGTPLTSPFARPVALPEIPTAQEQALIPLPPAAWSGLIGLALVGLIGSRKLVRFVL